jgi:ribulose-phosphate 3-epimerase
MSPVKIAPSIASADQSRLGWAVEEAERGGADLIHLDIEDGVFIPNLTFGPTTIKHLRPLTSLPFDVHLEVDRPEAYLEEVVEAGANVVTVQVEATRYPYRALKILKNLGVKAGFAFVAATPVDILRPALDRLDIVHLMTAEPNGVGAEFIPGMLEKIRTVRSMIGDRSIEIEVDGGINHDNAHAVVQAGATILVAGRAIWGAESTAIGIQSLRQAADKPRPE